MLQKRSIYLIYSLAALLTLSACGSSANPPPEFDIDQAIAATAKAAQTQTAISLPTLAVTPTPTISPTAPTPTATDFFDVLDVTPSVPYETLNPDLELEVSSFKFNISDEILANDKYSQEPWSCIGDGRYPPNGTVFSTGEPFTATWSVYNNGQRDWTQNTIDFVYQGGFRHDGNRIQDLDRYVASGRRVTFHISFTAPKTPGIYHAIWQLKVGSYPFCGIQFEFEVKGK